MGTVYRARDKATGAIVALKVLQGDDESDADRFQREAEVLARLDHPAIVRYVAHGKTESGAPWLAMEWLDGHALNDALAEQALSVEQALGLARATAMALGYAHAQGV